MVRRTGVVSLTINGKKVDGVGEFSYSLGAPRDWIDLDSTPLREGWGKGTTIIEGVIAEEHNGGIQALMEKWSFQDQQRTAWTRTIIYQMKSKVFSSFKAKYYGPELKKYFEQYFNNCIDNLYCAEEISEPLPRLALGNEPNHEGKLDWIIYYENL